MQREFFPLLKIGGLTQRHVLEEGLFQNVVGDKIKSSGWIMNVEDALGSIEFGASRVGNSLGPQWLAEFDKQRWSKNQ